MTTRTNARLLALSTVVLLLLAAVPAPAAPQGGVYLEVQSESGGQSQIIKMSLAPDRMRIDSDMGFSLINLGGEGGKMVMVQHDQKQYVEFTSEMMEAMAAMAGQMPQMEQDTESTEPPTFTRTGNTKQVGEWSAYEVEVHHPEQDGDLTMWLSQDVDADFSTLVQQVMDSISSLLNSPMMQMGGGNSAEAIEEFRTMSMGMPDGFPVQVISNAGGTESTTTLQAIDQNASFGPETWEPPAGYTKMDMPFIR